MGNIIPEALERLVNAYRNGDKLVLVFDYDGTLAPLEEHPRLAELPIGTRELLKQLAQLPRIFVGILSGRGLNDLKGMVGVADFFYAGNSGQELDLQGVRVTAPQAEKSRLQVAGLAAKLNEVAARYPGAWVENKGLGLTLHYRKVEWLRFLPLRQETRRAVKSQAGSFRLVNGPMAFEMTPAHSWNKGTALRKIVDHVNHIGGKVVPVYAGDEANDNDAMAAAAALGGIALGIGPSAPATAPYHLDSPSDLVGFLSKLLEVLKR